MDKLYNQVEDILKGGVEENTTTLCFVEMSENHRIEGIQKTVDSRHGREYVTFLKREDKESQILKLFK